MTKLEFIENQIHVNSSNYKIILNLGSHPLYPEDLQNFLKCDEVNIWNWNLFEVGERVYYSSASQFAFYDFIVSSHDMDNFIIHLNAIKL